MTESERRQLLFERNDPGRHFGEPRPLSERFEDQVERPPDTIAVEFENERLSYRELNRRANRLARHLRKLGAGPNVLVGICLERSLETVVSLIAVLKAGGAYVPMDPAYPAERLSFMLEDAQTPILVTEHRFQRSLSVSRAVRLCLLDHDAETIAREKEQNLEPASSSDDLAYVIYTSGSTGQPKGVLVTHRNVDRLFAATEPWFQFGAHDVWTLFHSFAFDFSVWELWGALRHGGRLVVVPRPVARSPQAFHELLARSGVTVLNLTPSAFQQLMAYDISSAAPLRLVIFGGEKLQPEMLGPWFDRHGDEPPCLVNMYGLTEATVHVTYHVVTRADLQRPAASVIGRPIPDLQVHVLNPQLDLCPIGVPGELHVAGAGLSRGYLRRPELTSERFVPNPFATRPGEHLYKSGDLARYLPNGEIEYLGRIDNQVKLRGYRVELGEVESALAEHPAVREAVVAAREDVPGDQRLIAYLIRRDRKEDPIPGLRDFLAAKLPDYMVPSAFLLLEAFPLTPNGKVDRRALPAPGTKRHEAQDFEPPRAPIEAALAEIWKEILRVERVSVRDNFFELGGHSLLATQVVSRIRAAFQIELDLRDLFSNPTVAGLAVTVAQKQAERLAPAELDRLLCELEAVTRKQTSPASAASDPSPR